MWFIFHVYTFVYRWLLSSSPPCAAYMRRWTGSALVRIMAWRRTGAFISWTKSDPLSIGPLWTNFSEILIEIQRLLLKKMHLKMSSAIFPPKCAGEMYTCDSITLTSSGVIYTCDYITITSSGPAFIKRDQISPPVNDQLKITQLSTIMLSELHHLCHVGEDLSFPLSQTFETAESRAFSEWVCD